MAISRYMYRPDQTGKPIVGDIVCDHDLSIRVFDGSSWIRLDDSAMFMKQHQLKAMADDLLHNKDKISDTYLEKAYPDLKMMRKQHEEEYTALCDKYRVFEILKANGATYA